MSWCSADIISSFQLPSNALIASNLQSAVNVGKLQSLHCRHMHLTTSREKTITATTVYNICIACKIY